MQKVLVDHIEKEHPRTDDESRSWQLMQALLVEWAECQNEWRGFKFWSTDQEPRVKVWKDYVNPMRGNGGEFKNSLLEETVDVIHCFLSFAIEKGWNIDMFGVSPEAVNELRVEGFRPSIHSAMIEVTAFLSKILFVPSPDQQRQLFRAAWFSFYCIVTMEFKFTSKELEDAYISKNEVNHTRQESGY